MTKIATQLSETGRRALAEFLAENLNDKTLRGLFSAWEDDVSFDINDGTAGHLEISGYYSRTGNPVVRFFGDEEVILEDVEDDDGQQAAYDIITAWVRNTYHYEGLTDPMEALTVCQVEGWEIADHPEWQARVGDWFVSDETIGTVVRVEGGAVRVIWTNG